MKEDKTPKPRFDPKRKSALLTYLAVLFAVAFLLILLSLLVHMRNSSHTISELNASSQSAMANLQQLQDDNKTLTEENAELSTQVSDLNEQLTQYQSDLNEATQSEQTLQAECDTLGQQAEQSAAEKDALAAAYELLAGAQAAYYNGDRETMAADLKTLSESSDLLGTYGKALYTALQEAAATEQ